jgi:hypothetical protein
MVKGHSVNSAFKQLEQENTKEGQALYGRLTEKMVQNDWDRRKEWEPIVLQLRDGSLLHEIIAGMKETIPQAWAMYSMSISTKSSDGHPRKPNLPVALGALNTLQTGYVRLLTALQDSGIIDKAALKIMATVEEKPLDVSKLSEDERKALVTAAKIVEEKSSES